MKILFLFTVICLFAVNGFAAVKSWDGGGADNNWGTAANWLNDVAPVAGDDLIFPVNAAKFSTNNNIGFLTTTYRSVTIEGGDYTIGGNGLHLTNGLKVDAGTQAINTIVSLGNAQTFFAGENSITVIAVLSVQNFPLTFDGRGAFAVGVISGTGSITKNGLGAVLLAAASNYSGALFINAGFFVVDANIPNSPVTVNATATLEGTPFGLSGLGGTGTIGAANVTSGVISAGTLQSPTGILNISNGLTFSADGIYLNKIGGTNPGADGYDQLNVTGAVNLNNARLEVFPLSSLGFGNFSPAIGDTFVILKNDGTDPINGTFQNAQEGAIFGAALNTAYRITYHGGDGNDIAITRVNRAKFDFDGDGKSDISLYRPSDRVWYINNSSNSTTSYSQFGLATDKIVPADFDGDGKTDIAVFRPETGVWFILKSSGGTQFTQFGSSEDIPQPSDFNGDGKAEIAVFRPSTGVWFILNTDTLQSTATQYGASEDKPVAADYDGDGKAEIAVYRPSSGVWFLRNQTTGQTGATRFGIATDKPVPADYDGDGKVDIAVYRPNEGNWYILPSTGGYTVTKFGLSTDVPTPGDYDGDGRTDFAVYRPAEGNWYQLKSRDGFTITKFGLDADRPTLGAFVY